MNKCLLTPHFLQNLCTTVFATSLVLLTTCSSWATELAAEDSLNTRVIAAPYMTGNSDDGITLGFGLGISRSPLLYSILAAEYSLSEQMNVLGEGEIHTEYVRYVGRLSFNSSTRSIYPSQPVDPEPLLRSEVERLEFKLSALRTFGTGFEIGPAGRLETAKGLHPEDPDGNPLELDDYPRFIPGALAMGGLRARWRTTSAVRPLDGSIVDLTTLFGAAWSDSWDESKPDALVQFKIATARPVADWMRVYLRAETQAQWNSPPPVRAYNGGNRKVRGQAKRREVGRRAITTRAQTHFTLIRDWRWPMETASRIVPFLPVYELELELVPFYDMGVIADPDFGWLPTRHGVGVGLHLVIPPELVIRIDVGVSPGGSPRYYFTIGEAI